MKWLSLNALDSRRFRGLLYLCLIMVSLVLGYLLFMQISRLQQLKNAHQVQIVQLTELKQALSDLPNSQNQQQQNQIKLDQILSLFAVHDQAIKVAVSLSNQLVESGLQIRLFQPTTSQSKNQSINFQVFGSYQQLINFLQANSVRWPLSVVEEINIIPEASASSRLLISGVIKICELVDQSLLASAC